MKKPSPRGWLRNAQQLLGPEEFSLRVYTACVLLALAAFIVLAVVFDRKESLYYNVILFPTVLVTALLQKHLRIPGTLFVMFSLLFVLHAMGGGLYFDGMRLYDMRFLGLKYDNYVHFYGSFVSTFLVYNLIYPYIKPSKKWYDVYLQIILIFMAAGLGTLVEMVEFLAVVTLGPSAQKGVGDYFNNALDLVVNMAGAVIGSLVVMQYHYRRRK